MKKRDGGKIITFYSYKGGTGRSMALANVAWILASHQKRVLVIDWDLEAPGLHRYFHPFLEDKELTTSPGLIDYATEFAEAARHAKRDGEDSAPGSASFAWHEPYLSLLRFTYSLDWDFGDGTLDLVPAGQQGPGYALRVNGFNWSEFYERLGGGVLLEGLKQRLRQEYDYILIDSRTGISDTSGVCTVQMPDDVVVCFTLNQQSVKGAAAIADSADQQRRRSTGEPSLRVWPVATRVELGEKDRLDSARAVAQAAFARYLRRLTRHDRGSYWSAVEILYQPYFAYEEVLAVFAERRQQRASMLSSLENLTRFLTDGDIDHLDDMPEEKRLAGLEHFRRPAPEAPRQTSQVADRHRVFVAYPFEEAAPTTVVAEHLVSRLTKAVWWEGYELLPGDDIQPVLWRAFDAADILVVCFGVNWLNRDRRGVFEQQIEKAMTRDMRIVPVLLDGLSIADWRRKLGDVGFAGLGERLAIQVSTVREHDLDRLVTALAKLLERSSPQSAQSVRIDPQDPQKGQWGGRSSNGQRELSATVRPVTDDWFEIDLVVASTDGKPLDGAVEFHLHPTFTPPMLRVQPHGAEATLTLGAWGAFTVGVMADGGRTLLELDLAEDTRFPTVFRER